jgi:hypothetical protein
MMRFGREMHRHQHLISTKGQHLQLRSVRRTMLFDGLRRM